MATLTFTKRFDAPQAEVFMALTDFHHNAEHVRGIERIEVLTDGPIGKGTRFSETRIMFKKECTEEMEITEFEQPNRHTIECDSCGMHYRTEMELIAIDGQTTDVHVKFEAKPQTFFAKLMSPLSRMMMGTVRKCIEQDFDDLADHLRKAAPT